MITLRPSWRQASCWLLDGAVLEVGDDIPAPTGVDAIHPPGNGITAEGHLAGYPNAFVRGTMIGIDIFAHIWIQGASLDRLFLEYEWVNTGIVLRIVYPVPIACMTTDQFVIVVILIQKPGQGQALCIALAEYSSCLIFGALQRGHENSHQNSYNRNNNQQFDQSKSSSSPCGLHNTPLNNGAC